VTNQLEREQRKHDQEATRKLTLLRQRKISAVLKADSLKKSLKGSSSNGGGCSLDSKMQQVKELEEEMAVVDRELEALGEEREEKSRRLNLKRMQHISTLQQLSLLDSLGGSEDIDAKWTSQSTEELLGVGPPETGSSSFETRKLSPPLLAVLGDSSRCRSGSDPSISKPGFSNSDKTSIGSFADRKARNNSTDTSFSSPKSNRRNPFRMLSNAIDFRNRRKVHRPKSADCERGSSSISEHPAGDSFSSTMDSGSYVMDSATLLAPPPRFPFTMTTSRHSLPNLDPNDMVEAQAMTRGESSPFMTSSPRKTKLPPPRHPLENRNSAPDIVVTGTTGLTQFRHSSLGNCPTSGPAINPTGSRRQQHPLEDRIHRAKARVQNGLYNLSSTSQSSSASSIYSTNSLNKPQKLSTRFQTATKINYKLAALSSFANVKRSRTFNISDVQEPTSAMTIGSSRTLPKPPKPKLVELGSGASSTASSRKSSNTSSNSSHSCSGCSSCCGENEKYEISQEALNEIAAFGTFLEQFHERQQSQSQTSSKTSPTSTTSSSTNISHKPPIQHRKANNSKTLERQQKIQDN